VFDRIRQMVIKEFLQTFRDPRMRGIILVAPVVQLLLFGYAVSTDVRAVPLAVRDEDVPHDGSEPASRLPNIMGL